MKHRYYHNFVVFFGIYYKIPLKIMKLACLKIFGYTVPFCLCYIIYLISFYIA